MVDRPPDGTPIRIAGTIADITERKKLRERLEQAERLAAVGALAGSMAHEIKTRSRATRELARGDGAWQGSALTPREGTTSPS